MLLDRRNQYLAAPSAHPKVESLLDRFNQEFMCVQADQPELLRRAYETRFRVYCVENTFENPAQHEDGLESDAFDERSSHSVLLNRNGGDSIGTVRLILPLSGAPQSFSLQNIIDIHGGDSPIPPDSTGEVSRFSISKTARRV